MPLQRASARRFISATVIRALASGAFAVATTFAAFVIIPGIAAANSPTCAQGGGCLIGDVGPGGGVVFYISDGTVYEMDTFSILFSGRVGYGDNTSSVWCPGQDTTDVSTGTAIGTGAANTAAMDAVCGDGGPAQLITDTVRGGQSDWFLPSRDEMQALVDYLLASQEPNGSSVGDVGLSTNQYWTSSQGSETNEAWRNKQDAGAAGEQAKTANFKFRAIRSFADPRPSQDMTWTPNSAHPVNASPTTLETASTSGDGAITYSVTSDGGTSCAFADSSTPVLTYSSAGSCAVTAIASETSNYIQGTASATITISLVTPSIAWTPATAFTMPAATTTLATPTTSSDGAISYAVISGGSICSVDASTGALTYTSRGQCVISATTAATSTYESASTTVTITIASARAPGGGGSGGGGSGGGGSGGGGSGGGSSAGGTSGNTESGVSDSVGSPVGPRPSPPGANVEPVTFADAGRVPPRQVSALAPAQVASIPSAQFKNLAPEVFKVLTAAHVSELPTELVRAIRPKRAASLSPDAVAGMSSEQLSTLRLASMRAMSPEQIAAISTDVIADVQPIFMAQLKPKVLAAMDATVIAALSPEQAAAIRPAALARLPIALLRQLAPEAFAALSMRQLRKLSPRQTSRLTSEQVAELTPTQRGALRRS